MSSSEILEGNKLIAQFMDLTPNPHDGNKTWSKEVVYSNGDLYGIWEQLNYNSSWNELMQVVEKIQSLGFKFIIGDQNRVTVYNKDYDWRNGHTSDSLITCVWHAVVAFIKWYNQQSK